MQKSLSKKWLGAKNYRSMNIAQFIYYSLPPNRDG